MDSLPICISKTATSTPFPLEFCSNSFPSSRRFRHVQFAKKPKKVSVFATKDEPPPTPPLKLDKWDQMELKFGKLLGEDPKLTLAKIMARKEDPDVSYMEVEKAFFSKKKGKFSFSELEEVSFDVSEGKKQVTLPSGLNLVRPVPKKGVKFETSVKSIGTAARRPSQKKDVDSSPSDVPNVLLRKPSLFNEVEDEKSLPISIKPKLSWKLENEPPKEENFDFILLDRPTPLEIKPNIDEENHNSRSLKSEALKGNNNDTAKNISLLGRPEPLDLNVTSEQSNTSSGNDSNSSEVKVGTESSLNPTNPSAEMMNMKKGIFNQSVEFTKVDASDITALVTVLQPSDLGASEKSDTSSAPPSTESREADDDISGDAALLGKPKRLKPLTLSLKAPKSVAGEDPVPDNPQSHDSTFEEENFLESPIMEHEEIDWTRAEELVKSGGRAEIEVMSTSTKGFAVSFGSLIGFLPYRNLAAKWRFLAFESWLRRKGLDPSKYKQNLGIVGSSETANKVPSSESSLDSKVDDKIEGEVSGDIKLEDLLRIYDQEKLKFLSSFVGQRINVIVVLVDRRSRRLIFSIKPQEKEESIERKRNLMNKLNVGDVVKCCIKKITYFGVFVEVEGVPALIHQSEVSWDTTLDPASHFKVGQVIDAKVHQLDYSLGRIFLSLKEIMPDPLVGALEAVVDDNDLLKGRLEATQPEEEWAEVESLIKELQQVEGIQSVSKGRYLLSPGLAPTFQVYMTSMSENQYKLLARSGNKAQEVIVESTLPKEEMKSAISTCTDRVE